jgi:hypothetical protein
VQFGEGLRQRRAYLGALLALVGREAAIEATSDDAIDFEEGALEPRVQPRPYLRGVEDDARPGCEGWRIPSRVRTETCCFAAPYVRLIGNDTKVERQPAGRVNNP